MKWDFEYQHKDVQDRVAHLEHLQAVLKKFDLIAVSNKEFLICYF